MHPKGHAVGAQIRGYGPLEIALLSTPAAVEAHGIGITKRLGIIVAAREAVIFIGVFANDVTGCLLLEVHQRQTGLGLPVQARPNVLGVELLLAVARVRAPTVVVDGGQPRGQSLTLADPRTLQLKPPIADRVALQADRQGHLARVRQYQMQAAELGVAAKQRRVRPFIHLDATGNFEVGIEQLIGVAKALGPKRNTLFAHPEGAAGASAGEHR